jgi:hypothetical protein
MSRWPNLVAPMLLGFAIPALFLAAGCSTSASDRTPLAMQVGGRQILIPVPPGMARYKVTHGGYFHWFEALVWRSHGPFYAIAAVQAHDEPRAREELAERLATRLGTSDATVLAAWEQAMRAGVAGGRGTLPEAPEGYLTIERVTATPDLVIDVMHNRRGDERNLIGGAEVLIRGRALALTVVLRQPVGQSDLALVRSVVVEWVRAVRAANP